MRKLLTLLLVVLVAFGGYMLSNQLIDNGKSTTRSASANPPDTLVFSYSGYFKQNYQAKWSSILGVQDYALYKDGNLVSTAGPGAVSTTFGFGGPGGQHSVAVWARYPNSTTTTAPTTTASTTTPTPVPTTTAPTTTTTPVPSGSKVGLYELGGSIETATHLTDGTYATVVADWFEADIVAGVSGIGFVYTVTAGSPGADPSIYTVLDNSNPQAYVDTVIAYRNQKGFDGVFLDNLTPSYASVSTIQYVSQRLHSAGILFGANVGNFVSGDPGSDDGTTWINWATQVGPYLDYAMLENWQQVSDNGTIYSGKVRPRGENWYQHWDGWERAPSTYLGGAKFMAITYGSVSDAVYGEASMLTASNLQPGAIFVRGLTYYGDPYDPGWINCPNPRVDPVAVTASC